MIYPDTSKECSSTWPSTEGLHIYMLNGATTVEYKIKSIKQMAIEEIKEQPFFKAKQ